ncbi:MAG: four helix bundle protein [Nitrospirota bacterium]
MYDAVTGSKAFQKDMRFASQITSASISAMSNIAEGFSRRFNKEFVQYLFISQGSVAEVQSQTYIAIDQSYINKPGKQSKQCKQGNV